MKVHVFVTIISLIIVSLSSTTVMALEADQYNILKHQIHLKDASELINNHLNEDFEKYLSKNSAQRKSTCNKVAQGYYKYVRPNILKHRLVRFFQKTAQVDLYPRKKSLFKDYKKSVYRGFYWPFVMPIAQTVYIDGVYVGTDKLAHYFSSGRRYFRRYLKHLKHGKSHREALKEAIYFGISNMEEDGVLGLWSSGAFSYSDLEANFQGMYMAIDMCRDKNPVIVGSKGNWRQGRRIDIRKYITPLWDEAYNNSYVAPFRAKRFKKVIQSEYCHIGNTKFTRTLWSRYNRDERQSYHTDIVRGLVESGEVPDPRPLSLASICGYTDSVLLGPRLWRGPYRWSDPSKHLD